MQPQSSAQSPDHPQGATVFDIARVRTGQSEVRLLETPLSFGQVGDGHSRLEGRSIEFTGQGAATGHDDGARGLLDLRLQTPIRNQLREDAELAGSLRSENELG